MDTWKQILGTGVAVLQFKDLILLSITIYSIKMTYHCFRANRLTIRKAINISSLSSHKWFCFFLPLWSCDSSFSPNLLSFICNSCSLWGFLLVFSDVTVLSDICLDEVSSLRILFNFLLLRKSFLSTLSEVVSSTFYHVLSILLINYLLLPFVAVSIAWNLPISFSSEINLWLTYSIITWLLFFSYYNIWFSHA